MARRSRSTPRCARSIRSDLKRRSTTVTLKNFATPWTNRDQTVFAPLNDYTATVIGMVRDDVHVQRTVLSGRHSLHRRRGISPGYCAEQQRLTTRRMEDQQRGPQNRPDAAGAVGVDRTCRPTATAGVITTPRCLQAFFIAGTNRAMFRFTLHQSPVP